MLISRKEDGTVKVQVYQKVTHTDQYLHFSSRHPLNHKVGVIGTLYDRCDNIVTEKADVAKVIDNVNRALGACGYPSWSFKKVDQREQKNNRKTSKDSKDKSTKTRVTLPYIRGVSEALSLGLLVPWSGDVDETTPDT